ncbi:MAG TPA: hypothetical protein VI039_01245 [Solirubrobacterales bacterium]
MLEIAIIIALILAVAHALEEAGPEADPLDMARPSVERLDLEAERAVAELRALDREERS